MHGARQKAAYSERASTSQHQRINIPPLLIVDDDGKPSELVDKLIKQEEYPSLMQKQSWTKSVPHRECFQYYKPSESIGSSYTPTAKNLKIQDLPPSRRRHSKTSFMLDEYGKLKYPPKVRKVEHEVAKENVKRKEPSIPGIVKLRDLLTGAYHEQKILKEEKKIQKQKIAAQKQELKNKAALEEETKVLKQLEAVEPIHPDDQLQMLKDVVKREQSVVLREEDLRRLQYYLTEVIMYNDLGLFYFALKP